ncbi:MAG: hypothetical protein IJT18_03295, partial [Oscillospiraceae bacterium]|nr:hypothetical protein [Oscillospiraceae bacterium]
IVGFEPPFSANTALKMRVIRQVARILCFVLTKNCWLKTAQYPLPHSERFLRETRQRKRESLSDSLF